MANLNSTPESPYITSTLDTQIMITPRDLNNNIYKSIKNILNKKLLNKCYNEYGYINKIFSIKEKKNPIIMNENLNASVFLDIKFSCLLCKPLINQQIIAEIEQISKVFIKLKNGPIKIFVTNENINKNIFYIDNLHYLRYKENNTSKLLEPSQHVLITLTTNLITNGASEIISMGVLDNVANEEQIKQYYDQRYLISNNDESNNDESNTD
jgi:DNA-directed RNA polymerase subunit E'/Rpb7